MKKKVITFLAIGGLLLALILPLPVQASEGNWTIDGNRVFVDDANTYLSATPHTLGSSGWVEFELQSKGFSGDIDAVWGFNLADGVRPTKPQIWAENVAHDAYSWVETEKTVSITFDGVTTFNPLLWNGHTPDTGNANNEYLVELTYVSPNMGIITQKIAYNSYYVVGDSYAFSLLYTEQTKEHYTEYYDDWKPLLQTFSTVSHSFAGMDTWYVLRGVNVQAEVTYKVRVWVEIPFTGLDQSAGKYAWGVKPSFETITEARDGGHLYLLDPWWDIDWSYKRKLTFDNSGQAESLLNFPVLIYFADPTIDFDKIKAAGADIRFVDADDSTELKYEIDKWDDTAEEAWVWVKVPQVDASSATDFIYIYYGNNAASDGQDAENVWDSNFKLVTHMGDDPDTSHVADSTSNDNDGTKGAAGEPTVITSGEIDNAQEFDGTDDWINCGNGASLDITEHLTLELWVYRTDRVTNQHLIMKSKVDAGPHYGMFWEWYAQIARFGLFIGDWTILVDTVALPEDEWHYIAATYDGEYARIYSAGSEDDNAEQTGDIGSGPDSNVILGSGVQTQWGDNWYEGYMDEVRISSTSRSAAWIKASYESGRDNFVTFGSEESFVAPTVTTKACTGFDKLWAIVNGYIDSSGSLPVTQVGFEYGLTTSYGANRTATGSWTTGDDFWIKLIPLTPATVFHYRAMAYDGFWRYGGDMIFSTEGSATLYENLNTGGDGDSGTIYSANWTAEQFTSDNASHTATSIRVPLKRVGTTPGTVTLAMTYADSDNFSTGADLTTATLNGNTMTTSYVWYDFDITDITLDGASKYTIVVKALSGSATDYILWQRVDAGALDDAVGSHSSDSGISWISDSPADYLFEIWGEPVISVEGANVFSGYVETGDWLVTLTYKNTYAPYYPNENVGQYFYLQLVDDTAVIAQVNCPMWGYRPGSIYIAKSLADSLEWGSTDYKIRLIGSFSGTPHTDYVLTALDWKGSELSLLDKWIIAQANSIGEHDEVPLTTFIADKGEVLNATGHTIFSIGIPEINVVRPDLFEVVTRAPGIVTTDHPQTLQESTDWEERLGPEIVAMLNKAGELIGQEDGRGVGGFLFFLAFMVLVVLGAVAGHVVVGLCLGYPFILAGGWLGVIDWILVGVITFIAVVIFVWAVFFTK